MIGFLLRRSHRQLFCRSQDLRFFSEGTTEQPAGGMWETRNTMGEPWDFIRFNQISWVFFWDFMRFLGENTMELTNHSETLGSEWYSTNRNGDFKHFKKTVSQLEMIYKCWRKTHWLSWRNWGYLLCGWFIVWYLEFGPNYCQEHNLLIDRRCIYIYTYICTVMYICTYNHICHWCL